MTDQEKALYLSSRTPKDDTVMVFPKPAPLFFFRDGIDIEECKTLSVKAFMKELPLFKKQEIVPEPPVEREKRKYKPKPWKESRNLPKKKIKYKPFPKMLSQRKWGDDERAKIRKLYDLGLDYDQIAKEMGRKRESVYNFIYRNFI